MVSRIRHCSDPPASFGDLTFFIGTVQQHKKGGPSGPECVLSRADAPAQHNEHAENKRREVERRRPANNHREPIKSRLGDVTVPGPACPADGWTMATSGGIKISRFGAKPYEGPKHRTPSRAGYSGSSNYRSEKDRMAQRNRPVRPLMIADHRPIGQHVTIPQAELIAYVVDMVDYLADRLDELEERLSKAD